MVHAVRKAAKSARALLARRSAVHAEAGPTSSVGRARDDGGYPAPEPMERALVLKEDAQPQRAQPGGRQGRVCCVCRPGVRGARREVARLQAGRRRRSPGRPARSHRLDGQRGEGANRTRAWCLRSTSRTSSRRTPRRDSRARSSEPTRRPNRHPRHQYRSTRRPLEWQGVAVDAGTPADAGTCRASGRRGGQVGVGGAAAAEMVARFKREFGRFHDHDRGGGRGVQCPRRRRRGRHDRRRVLGGDVGDPADRAYQQPHGVWRL